MNLDREMVLNAALTNDLELLGCVDDEDLLTFRVALSELYFEYYFDHSREDRDEALAKLTVQLQNMDDERIRRELKADDEGD